MRPELPVILATGYAAALDRTLPVTVISKPYDMAEVGRILSEAVARRRTRS